MSKLKQNILELLTRPMASRELSDRLKFGETHIDQALKGLMKEGLINRTKGISPLNGRRVFLYKKTKL